MAERAFIGSGAGFAGDRSDAAIPVVESLAQADGPKFLIYETLAERTLALCRSSAARMPRAAIARRWSACSRR